ncbi:PadR family transcriptional regulator [Mycobacterium sp. 663a-19]|uniref:PadR family transcriptional regulator n=1 Tax=Mycobacterium sp. 663a-19 TaxID=2986148 RepID=UPI002D1EE67F|nr:PadR family transcriptional regulator [Mycobacterium sp. 663a-19]MEB3980978.1 PadR family transcriptional regulator [Mycobacterium sp. 663a-19]
MRAGLSTTSYAVLGLLSLRSWTGYELAQQGRRSLRFCWPKEDSVFYEEPRRLVARGLASAVRERNGGRSRNRYEITDEGRQALTEWLGETSSLPRIELEPCLRFLFADQGDREDALRAGAALRSWAQEHIDSVNEILRQYQAGEVPFPERLHISALGARFVSDLFHTIMDFADFAEEEIKNWPRTDGLGLTPRTKEILDELVERENCATPQPRTTERRD